MRRSTAARRRSSTHIYEGLDDGVVGPLVFGLGGGKPLVVLDVGVVTVITRRSWTRPPPESRKGCYNRELSTGGIVTEPALSLQHISKSLATSPRWADLSLDVPRGGFSV